MASKNPTPEITTANFETTLKALDEIVHDLEQGGLSLEKSLELFEKGIQLTRHCQQELKTAEQKVQLLVEQNNSFSFTNYQSEADD